MKLSDHLKDLNVTDSDLTGDLSKDTFDFCKKNNINLQEFGSYIGYRLSFGKMMVIYTISDNIAGRAIATNIKSMPTELPERLKDSFLFEAEGDGVLFDDIVSIGGFILNGDLVLIIAYKDENTVWQHERGSFDGRTIENIQYDNKPDMKELGEQLYNRIMDKNTFAFVLSLANILDTNKPNIREVMITDQTNWLERSLYLDN